MPTARRAHGRLRRFCTTVIVESQRPRIDLITTGDIAVAKFEADNAHALTERLYRDFIAGDRNAQCDWLAALDLSTDASKRYFALMRGWLDEQR